MFHHFWVWVGGRASIIFHSLLPSFMGRVSFILGPAKLSLTTFCWEAEHSNHQAMTPPPSLQQQQPKEEEELAVYSTSWGM